jgi:hypothetical protein
MLREPRTGRAAPLTRLVALTAAVILLAVSAPALWPVLVWVLRLL